LTAARTQKFIAPTLRQALDAMRRELGDDALLLATRSGVDANGSPYAEVVGMTTGAHRGLTHAVVDAAGTPQFPSRSQRPVPSEPVPLRYYLEQSPERPSERAIAALQEEIHHLSAKLTAISHAVAYRYSAILPDPYRRTYQLLRDAGFSEHHAGYLIARLAAEEPARDVQECIHRLRSVFVELLPTSRLITDAPPGAIAFTGPSGSGKTTTLMKVAILLQRAYPESTIRLVTADTERIAAAQQLRSFATLTGMELEVFRKGDATPASFQTHPNSITLVDLPPPSKRMTAVTDAILASVEQASGVVIFTLPATCDAEVAQRLLQRAIGNPSYRIALTKVDEAPQCGHLLSLFWELRLPISLLTTGTQLPDDVIEPTVDYLLQLLIPSGNAALFTTA
jgi:flagellar biosynthesis protein FlhF